MKVKTALNRALKSVILEPRDEAATELAKRYAELLDSDKEFVWRVGPRLLDVLVELGMTPKARASVLRGGMGNDGGSGKSALDELRSRRANRAAS